MQEVSCPTGSKNLKKFPTFLEEAPFHQSHLKLCKYVLHPWTWVLVVPLALPPKRKLLCILNFLYKEGRTGMMQLGLQGHDEVCSAPRPAIHTLPPWLLTQRFTVYFIMIAFVFSPQMLSEDTRYDSVSRHFERAIAHGSSTPYAWWCLSPV